LGETTTAALQLETWPLERLVANPENYRGHPDAQIEHLRQSLREFGWYKNVVATESGVVLAGHGIVAAAKAEGMAAVPVYVYRGDEAGARKLMVADNEASRLAEDDADQLSQLLAAIAADSESGLTGTGHDEASLAALLEEVAGAAVPTGVPPEDEGPGEPPAEAVTRLGDVWVMGNHRLVCGDATGETAWSVLGGERSGRVAFWSPPYAISSSVHLSGNATRARAENAYLSGTDSADGWRGMMDDMSSMAYAFAEVAVINVQPLANNKRELVRWMAANADRLCDVVTWDKGHAAPQIEPGVLASRYEWLVILADEAATRVIPLSSWRGTVQSLYEGPPQRGNQFAEIHGATFPVHLPSYVLATLCDKSRAVVDCCMGTGTTLVAAEQLGRVCYGIEIEPRYCDVSVRRWQKFTGQRAILESTGEPFPETG
jgi:hypothetical protein